jgi:hypothetical protein
MFVRHVTFKKTPRQRGRKEKMKFGTIYTYKFIGENEIKGYAEIYI